MTGIDPERLERRLRWAAKQLGLNPQATPEEVRAAWLRRLAAEDFVPSSEARWALAALLNRQLEGGWEARADEAATLAEEEERRGEVEAFAAQYWDLSPDERRRRWDELSDRCAFAPALRARLRLLEAGLDCASVVNDKEEDSRAVELSGHVHELFVLRPGPRAHARQSLLGRIRNDREWKVAARYLQHNYPELAALASDLLDKRLTETPEWTQLEDGGNRVRPEREPAMTKVDGPSSHWPVWIFVFIAVTIIRLFATAFKDSSSSSPEVRFPSSLLHPHRSPMPPPILLEKLLEKEHSQDEKLQEEEKKKLLESLLKMGEGEKNVDKKGKMDGKNP